MFRRRGRRLRHALRPVEVEAGVIQHLFGRVAGMEAFEAEAPALAVEGEDAAIGDERDGAARPIDARRARARRADEIDLVDERAARMLEAEENDARHDVIEIGRAEGARKAHLRRRIIADRDEIDVGGAVDLSAREEEGIDPPLAGAVEELAPAIGEEIVARAREQRDERLAFAEMPG